MANIPDNISMEQVLRFARSPAGQKLMQALQAGGGEQLSKIKALSENADYASAQKAIAELLRSPQMKNALLETEQYNG